MGWLFDPDNPELWYSRMAGEVIAVALPIGGVGSNILKHSRVVIGESMGRVKTAAFWRNATYYKPGPVGGPLAPSVSTASDLMRNGDWLVEALRDGKKVIDIGIDLKRKDRSIFYNLERRVMDAWEKGIIPGRGGGPWVWPNLP
jgi:hypothetical protein